MRAFVKGSVLLLSSLMIALLLCEAILRIVAPQSVAIPWQDEIDGITAPRPGVRGRHAIPDTFDVQVSFNAQRFRAGKDYAPKPSQRVLRIAILGDSFTFGYGANNDQTYPAQLERILQQRDAYRRKNILVEVINAGNGGTGTGEQALWYDVWVKRFNPHIILLTVASNDVDDDLARGLFVVDKNGEARPRSKSHLRDADGLLRSIRRAANAVPGYPSLAQRSQLLGLIRNASSAAIARWRSKPAASLQESDSEDRYRKQGLALMAAEVIWLWKRIQKTAGRLAVVFVPSRESIHHSQASWGGETRAKSAAIVRTLREICSREGIPFADLTAYMREQANKSPAPLYYNGLDTHPNPEGYHAIAEGVARFVTTSKLPDTAGVLP